MLDDYLKTNPGVKDLHRPGIEPQPPSPQSDAITIRPQQPLIPVCLIKFANHASSQLQTTNPLNYELVKLLTSSLSN